MDGWHAFVMCPCTGDSPQFTNSWQQDRADQGGLGMDSGQEAWGRPSSGWGDVDGSKGHLGMYHVMDCVLGTLPVHSKKEKVKDI